MDLVHQDFETINKENFKIFLDQIRRLYPKDKKIHLILDQAGYHTARCVQEYAGCDSYRLCQKLSNTALERFRLSGGQSNSNETGICQRAQNHLALFASS